MRGLTDAARRDDEAQSRASAGSSLIRDALRDKVFELALHLANRRRHHEHADKLFFRIDEEVGPLRACPAERQMIDRRIAGDIAWVMRCSRSDEPMRAFTAASLGQ